MKRTSVPDDKNGDGQLAHSAVESLVFDDPREGVFAGQFEAKEHGPSQKSTTELASSAMNKPKWHASVSPSIGKI